MTPTEREKEKKIGLAVVLEWQPGPVEALSQSQALSPRPVPMSGLITGAGLVDGLSIALMQRNSPDAANPLL